MQKTALNLAALISAALLTACGGSSDEAAANALVPTQADTNVLVPAPVPPDAAETAAFNADKQKRERIYQVGNTPFTPYSISVNGHTIYSQTGSHSNPIGVIDFRSLPPGFATYNGTYTEDSGSATVKVRSYQGFRSGILLTYNDGNEFVNVSSYGVDTPSVGIPAAGKATYTGTAFDHNERGSLTYNVNFAAKTGQGRIDGLNKYGSITLAEGEFTQNRQSNGGTTNGIVGKASAAAGDRFDYGVIFFGNHAEEITGYAVNEYKGIGLHGTRGAITE